MKKSRLLGAVCVLAAILLPAATNAALVERDWKISGDGLITYDPDTNLEWLDVSESVGFSYEHIVNNEFSVGGEFAGFHYAVRDDVRTFFENAGIGGINQVASLVYFNEITTLANLLGGGTGNGGVSGGITVWGISGETTSSPSVNWAPFLFWMPDPCVNCAPTHIPGEGQATLGGTLSSFWSYPNDAGSWLIREASPVPIPPALWLFGSGLLGLIGVARRKAA